MGTCTNHHHPQSRPTTSLDDNTTASPPRDLRLHQYVFARDLQSRHEPHPPPHRAPACMTDERLNAESCSRSLRTRRERLEMVGATRANHDASKPPPSACSYSESVAQPNNLQSRDAAEEASSRRAQPVLWRLESRATLIK